MCQCVCAGDRRPPPMMRNCKKVSGAPCGVESINVYFFIWWFVFQLSISCEQRLHCSLCISTPPQQLYIHQLKEIQCIVLYQLYNLPHMVFLVSSFTSDLSSIGERHKTRLNVIVYKTMLVSTNLEKSKTASV